MDFNLDRKNITANCVEYHEQFGVEVSCFSNSYLVEILQVSPANISGENVNLIIA